MRNVLAVVLWAGVPFLGNPLWGQAPGKGKQAGQEIPQQANFTTSDSKADKRGTEESPIVVETHIRPDSPQEAAEHKTSNDAKDFRERWTLYLAGLYDFLTGILVVIGYFGVRAANKTLRTIKKQSDLMEAQLVIPHRAYLSAGQARMAPDRSMVSFPIRNHGSVAATITKIEVEIIIQNQTGEERCRESSFQTINESIVHGEATAFEVNTILPWQPGIEDVFIISMTIDYSIGFKIGKAEDVINPTDTLRFTRVFDGDAPEWRLGKNYAELNFSDGDCAKHKPPN